MKALYVSKRIICLIFMLMMAFILINVLVISNFVDFFTKKSFILPNVFLLIFGLIAIGVFAIIGSLCKKHYMDKLDFLINRKNIAILSVVGFIIQCYIVYNIYFLTGWDVNALFNSAVDFANGGNIDSRYFSQYPNNIFLTFIYSFVLKINNAIGIFPENGGIFSLVVIQCVFAAITAYFVFSISFEFTKNKLISFFAFFTYSFYICFSPWFSIPYSDATGILFPIMIFRIWQIAGNSQSKKRKGLLYVAIGFLSFLAFKIKPQTFIIVIAVIIFDILKILFLHIKNKKYVFPAIHLSFVFLAFIVVSLIFSFIINHNNHINIDKEREYGLPHFLMMGLYEDTQGVWNQEDVDFSGSFHTKKERDEANINVAIERMKKMGFEGLLKHISKKAMLNFGDGTFAWGIEGNFFLSIQEEKNSVISPFLRSFYYEDGENYDVFHNVSQMMWLTILFLSSFAAVYALKDGNKEGDEMLVLMLSLIGLFIFETLFEARARYLFTYAPIFIICGCVGLYSILKTVKEKRLMK